MRSTLLVRCLMTAHGKRTIFTNKYEKCRTVKCYAGDNDTAMVKGIVDALTAAGVNHSVKITSKNATRYSPGRSLIVRLPL